MGRPEANINWEDVEYLLMCGCSGADIAAKIGISAPTLYDRCQTDNGLMFSEYSQQKKAKGDALIHQAQFEEAVNERDKSMLIWLGKQRLGQKDKTETEFSGEFEIKRPLWLNESNHEATMITNGQKNGS